jgi:hypothetical protein
MPMLWQKNKGSIGGGYWYCRERRRQYNETRAEQRAESNYKRWATDFVYRSEKALRKRRQEALRSLKARRERVNG